MLTSLDNNNNNNNNNNKNREPLARDRIENDSRIIAINTVNKKNK
jgi:hypothetical protein